MDIKVVKGIIIGSFMFFMALVSAVFSSSAHAAIPVTPSFTTSFLSGPTLGVSWTSSSGATSYQLERDGAVIYTGNQTTQTITSVGGKTYTHRVKACNGEGCSAWSAVFNASTPSTPTAISGLASNRSGPTIVITWAPSYFSTRYEIQRDGVLLATPTGNGYTDATGVGAKNYVYTVRACINTNCTTWASTNISTFFTPATPNPTNISTNAEGAVVFYCNSPSFFSTRYEVQRLKGGVVDAGIWQISTIGYADYTALPSTTYTYNMRACIDTLCSAWGVTSSITTPAAIAPAAPSSISASVIGSTIKVDWGSSSAGATTYELQRSGVAVTSGLITTYTDSPAAGVAYTYSVRACRYGACSAWVTSSSVALPPTTVGSVSNVNASLLQSTGVTSLTWNPSSTPSVLYSIQVKINGAASGAPQTASVPSYSFPAMTLAGKYTYEVKAFVAVGATTIYSAPVVSNAVTPIQPDSPLISAPFASSTGAYSVTWSKSLWATHYKLYENGVLIQDSAEWSKTFKDASRKSDGVYIYTVKACWVVCSADSSVAVVPVTLASTTTNPSNSTGPVF